MSWSVGVGGAYRTVAAMWVGVGGVWRPVQRADVGVGGAWRNGFAAISVDPTYSVISAVSDPANAFAEFEINTDGHLYKTVGAVRTSLGTWIVPGADTGQYAVTATLESGSVDSGTFGSLELDSTQSWSVSRNIVGSRSAVITLQFRVFGTATVLDSTTVTLEAEVTV